MALDADVKNSTFSEKFEAAHPERFYQCFIAEQVMVGAAKRRGEALNHILLSGPPGLGKTTLAFILGNELGKSVRVTSGPVIEKAGDVIPRVVAPIVSLRPEDSRPWVMPTECAACGSPLHRDEEEVQEHREQHAEFHRSPAI